MGARFRALAVAAISVVALAVPTHDASAGVARTWGVSTADLPSSFTTVNALSSSEGARPGVLMWYVAWGYNTAFPTADATAVTNWGATPEITWEPWNPSGGVSQPRYTLAKISRGSYDNYIKSWATAMKAWGKPIRLRFAHEMNGNWYPWAEGVNTNAKGSYVAAWKHVRSIFTSVGATNVSWVWSPNVPYSGSVALSQVFPGDAYVDEVALDGYNWGTTQTWSSWQSFHDVFAAGISQLGALSTRPVSIGEVGCTEIGGNKAQWMTDMWTTLSQWPQVRSLMWFDFNKETDWRIDSSASSAAAFANGLSSYLAG